MADIKKITLPNGTTYDIVDAGGRALIAELQAYTDYLGVTTTALADGATTNPISIDGKDVTAKKGNIANYGAKEFIFNGSVWQEFGDLSALGDLAYVSSADVTGTAAAQTFTGTEATISSTGTFTAAGTVALTTSEVSVVNGITDATTAKIKEFDEAGSVTAGSAAQFTQGTDTFTADYDADTETVTFGFTQGTDSFTANVPTAVTLPTSKETDVVTQQGTVTSGTIDVPSAATFTGTEDQAVSVSATYTPAGTNAASTVTGTATAPSNP